MYNAVGIHVFAGAFTVGVQRHFNVECQLETHNFGGSTCESMCNVPFINEDVKSWPRKEPSFIYGNPRCTGFSCLTAGHGEHCHGPWSAQTQDIHDLCEYGIKVNVPVLVWESVQQAYTTGKPLLDYLRDTLFVPNDYRIAHVLLNAASFGNAQQRRRYFFVAYKKGLTFNIDPPKLPVYSPTMYDAIYHSHNRSTHEVAINQKYAVYDEDSYIRLTDDEKQVVPQLPTGWNLNNFAKYSYANLPKKYRDTWDTRSSDMPFSMHCIYRTAYATSSPTLHSSAARFIHPIHNRPLTIGEVAAIMGWPTIPKGHRPFAQVAKGVCPEVAEWIALQAKYCLDGVWGSDDYESSYDPVKGEWVGHETKGEVEKTFNLTRYTTSFYNNERFPNELLQGHRFNVDPRTQRLVRPWDEIKQSNRTHGGDSRLVRETDEREAQFPDEFSQET